MSFIAREYDMQMSEYDLGILYSLSFDKTPDSKDCCSWLGACSFFIFCGAITGDSCKWAMSALNATNDQITQSRGLLEFVYSTFEWVDGVVPCLNLNDLYENRFLFAFFFICTDCLHRNLIRHGIYIWTILWSNLSSSSSKSLSLSETLLVGALGLTVCCGFIWLILFNLVEVPDSGFCRCHFLHLSVLDNKEVFVKHEQAPSAPKLEGVCFFVYFEYIFYENRYFWPIWQLLVGCFWPKQWWANLLEVWRSYDRLISNLCRSFGNFAGHLYGISIKLRHRVTLQIFRLPRLISTLSVILYLSYRSSSLF